MSVFLCTRAACGAVMCDYYSDTYGYVCTDCLTEAKEGDISSHSEMIEFLATSKSKPFDLDEEFKLV